MADIEDRFKKFLKSIEFADAVRDYGMRNLYIYKALAESMELGYSAGIRLDPQEPEWPVAYIELPTGQVSWHLPQHIKEWDGYTTEEKYKRIQEFING